ncbi:MAG: pyridoxamine 5'-phosphate oxidase family protein [Oscillospiraceae bacterium]|nr:pyridoxamine 5'-phosphate oxidase family protein [Oscillospiraceae bacterium]
MFRPMRRKRQQLSAADCKAVLDRGTSGVLSLFGDNGYPYGVPINYYRDGDRLLFHSAKSGHKIDAIGGGSKASFCVIDQDEIVPEEYTSYFRSVIAFGFLKILTDDREKRRAIELLAERFSPEQVEGRQQEIEEQYDHLCMLELTIEHLSGKEAMTLVKGRRSAE